MTLEISIVPEREMASQNEIRPEQSFKSPGNDGHMLQKVQEKCVVPRLASSLSADLKV
jgi:hypothetical protein